MTDLQKMYYSVRRERKYDHDTAVAYVAEQIGVDTGTVERCLARAREADTIDFYKMWSDRRLTGAERAYRQRHVNRVRRSHGRDRRRGKPSEN